MAQVVKLKRTSVQGRIPSISNLELGELAINTHDGRIFFEKDDGTLSIQEILTTNSQTSGSFNLTGAITASSLQINGNANITGNLVLGGNITIGDASSDTIAFQGDISSSLIPDITNVFDLGSTTRKFANVYATNLYGSINSTNGVVSGSSQIDVLQTTNFTDFSASVAETFGGLSTDYNDLQNIPSGIVSGSSQLTSSFDSRYLNVSGEGNISGSFTGLFVGDGSGLTNLSVDVGETSTLTASFDNQSTISIPHTFDSRNVLVSVYDTNYSQLIPQEVTLTDNNTVDIVLSNTGSGHVVLAKGGHVVSGSRIQIDEIASIDDTFTNQTSYTVNHTFETKNVFVIVYGDNDEQIIPALVSTPTTSSVELGFDTPTSGRIVIGKAGHIVSGSIAGSGGGGTSNFTELTNVPSGLVSSSVQVLGGSNVVSGSTAWNLFHVDILGNSDTTTIGGSDEFVIKATTANIGIATQYGTVGSQKQIQIGFSPGDLGTATSGTANPYMVIHQDSNGDGYPSSASKILRSNLSVLDFADTDGLVSGSSQLTSSLDSRYTLSGSTDLDLSAVSQSIVPISDNVFDLGSPTNQWRDLYLSSASLYIDGTKVLSSTSETLTFTTDNGQNIKLLEGGTDNITLQTEDGNLELKSSGGGNVLLDPTTGLIDVRGTLQIQDGQKITSSGANSIIFGDNIELTGSLSLSGTVDGVDISSLRGDVDAILLSADADKNSFTEIVTLINSVDTTNDIAFASHYTSSNQRMDSLEGFTSSIDTTIKTKLNTDGVISGSSQITITESQISDLTHTNISLLNSFTSSIQAEVDLLTSVTSSYLTELPSGVISGSDQLLNIDTDFGSGRVSGDTFGDIGGTSNFTGSFSGDGSQLTGTSFTHSFISQTALEVIHNLGTKNVTVQVYDTDDYMIFPTSIRTTTTDTVDVVFNTSRSGRVVITR